MCSSPANSRFLPPSVHVPSFFIANSFLPSTGDTGGVCRRVASHFSFHWRRLLHPKNLSKKVLFVDSSCISCCYATWLTAFSLFVCLVAERLMTNLADFGLSVRFFQRHPRSGIVIVKISPRKTRRATTTLPVEAGRECGRSSPRHLRLPPSSHRVPCRPIGCFFRSQASSPSSL